MGLRNHVVVVTGASSGIGRATTEAFARRGCAEVPAGAAVAAGRRATHGPAGA
ncbi:hypothetical protein ABZ250_23775 [Streptomyces afghaniensis]|uniref:hypothetical protein n=1 Tax=Streptomyces afghaniensis TaxID=66865 RepID=UPI0033A70C17